MKIMTLGNGFVANHLPYTKITERITANSAFISALLNLYKPDVLVNCIGFCGRPNVDQCETLKQETYLANVIIPSIVAVECEKLGIHFVHIGSGCIYFGESSNPTGWREDDFANPKSYYSKTKYACDLLLGQMPNVTTLRIRMPVSSKNDPRNFINKVRNYKQVIDIPNSMTIMDDLVRCIDYMIFHHLTGIYHVTNPEPITAAQVMREFQIYHPDHHFEVIGEAELDSLTIAKRSNCILNTDKLNKVGFFMTPSEEALKNCMESYVKNV